MIVLVHIANLAVRFQSHLTRPSHKQGLAPMSILPIEKQASFVSALTEGCSIRATERMTGAHRDTIMRLGVRVGQGCESLHSYLFRGPVRKVARIEFRRVFGSWPARAGQARVS